jgi:predicted glycoside hydrolase/deacetylase ChbG (UPF0249 family)
MSQAPSSVTNRLLGYPEDARLLLVNADDFGMYQAINEGIARAFAEGIVRSTSLMMPCPGASHAVQLLRDHPEIRFGVHLSIIRDIDTYHWDPLAPKELVPSLLDADGTFNSLGQMDELLERAKLDEVEIEFRAQIEAVLATGLTPTHLDWHCLHNGGRSDIFDLALRLAREYGLALRVGAEPFISQVQRQGLPTNEYDLLDSFTVDIDTKSARYVAMLRELPVGLTEWAVHPSLGDAASRAIDPDGWRVRRTDFDFLVSPQARQIIEREGITLIDYEPLQRAWQDRSS